MNLENNIPGRAQSNEEKWAVVERLYHLWTKHPALRLGQLIGNCFEVGIPPLSLRDGLNDFIGGVSFYGIEDEYFISALEKAYKEPRKEK